MDKQTTDGKHANSNPSSTQEILLKELQNMMAFFHVEQIKKQTDKPPAGRDLLGEKSNEDC